MTVIKTKDFKFPRLLYWMILIQETMRRSWWAALFLVSIAVFQSTRKDSMGFLWLAFPAAYFLYVLIRCWMHTTSKKNPLFFAERRCEIDDQSISFIFAQGVVNKIGINDIARVVKKGQFYRLFLNRKQFIFLPVHAFRTPGDMQRFEEILKARTVKKPVSRRR